jgi:phage baseplate assembly protein gpV
MRAVLLLVLFFCCVQFTQAKSCQVYGISDSPQKLQCRFPDGVSLKLSCQQGTYQLQWSGLDHEIQVSSVTAAFHLEVEEGNNPLVFKADHLSLTVEKVKKSFSAQFQKGKLYLNGHCFQ